MKACYCTCFKGKVYPVCYRFCQVDDEVENHAYNNWKTTDDNMGN